jgi:hypothetical protein
MAIDFGRAARGVATGYLQAKVRNTEANDQLKANILERAGANYFNEVLPEVTTMEKNRKNSYDRIATEFGGNAAELADINNIITGDGKGYDNFKDLMKTNNLNREKLDAVTFEGDYNTRFNTRGMEFQEKYQGIFDQIGIKQSGGLGPYTVESQLKEETPTAMTKDQMTDTVTPVQPVQPNFVSTQLEDYFTSAGTVSLLPETEFAKVASGFRNFQNSIIFRDDNSVQFQFKGTKDVEYNALRAKANDIAKTDKYTTKDGKVNIGAAVEEANFELKKQTQDHIGNNIVQGYSFISQDKATPGGALYTSQGFSQDFNESYQTADDKLDYIDNHMETLGSYSEQKYYAQSFPLGVKITINGKEVEVRDYLLSNF